MGVIFDQNSFKDKLKELESLIAEENLWNDNLKALVILKEKNFVEKIINEHFKLNSICNDLNDFVNSLEKEYDEDLYLELKSSLKSLEKNIKSLEANCYLSNESDNVIEVKFKKCDIFICLIGFVIGFFALIGIILPS